ncbi:MAG: choice-of-anchor B family protein [Bacteroidia bacterium]
MKKLYVLMFLFLSGILSSQVYPSLNVNFTANVDPETIVNWYGNGTKYSGCYGWHNPVDGKEYAILGTTQGNYFIDISVPSTPVINDFVPGAAQASLWREIKTYQNYAYLVSDDSNSKLQIVDMSYLPDSVHVVYESDILFSRSHTIYIDGTHLYCGGVTTLSNGYSMQVYDISNPVNPVLLRTLSQDAPQPGYVHDMFVRNDTVFASGGNAGLFIFKYNSGANNFTPLASLTSYVQQGYNHSSSLTADGKTLVFADEVPANTVVKILDVSNLGNLTVIDTIKSHEGATPHNPYVIGNERAVVSYYQDGLAIFDISDPANVSMVGFFDTDPAHGVNDNFAVGNTYQGCWGTYPYLPSGVLLASDMQNGLFILDASQALSVKSAAVSQFINVYPNPAMDNIGIAISSQGEDLVKIDLYDLAGKLVRSFSQKLSSSVNKFTLSTSDIANGCYILKVKGQTISHVGKVIISGQ